MREIGLEEPIGKYLLKINNKNSHQLDTSAYLELSQASKMELFAKIVNGSC